VCERERQSYGGRGVEREGADLMSSCTAHFDISGMSYEFSTIFCAAPRATDSRRERGESLALRACNIVEPV